MGCVALIGKPSVNTFFVNLNGNQNGTVELLSAKEHFGSRTNCEIGQDMMGLVSAWRSLALSKKVISVLAVAATVMLLVMFARQAAKPEMALLYSGLETGAAGDVVLELDNLGAVYEVRGETIYVDAGKRDELRLQLAREGLPQQGSAGYELLDNLNSFAMTSEMFNTAYWRAKEGEIARTLSAMPGVRAARVHIGASKQTSFSRAQMASSASVTVTTANGIDSKEAKAIQYLTALAVAGLAPNDVAVIDTNYGVVAGPGQMESGNSVSEEADRADKIEQTLRSLLEAHVGVGNVRVSANLEIDRQSEATSERVIDPDSRVIKSRSATEVSQTSAGSDPYVSVDANTAEQETQEATTNSNRSETQEQAEYDMSVVQRETQKLPGGITKMTVAVLINERMALDEEGNPVPDQRSEAELANLRELAAAAAGVNEARGDVLTIKSLPFTIVPEVDRPAPPSPMESFMDRYLWSGLQALILAVVVLVLGLFVVKPLLTQRGDGDPALALADHAGASGTAAAAGGGAAAPMLEAEAAPEPDNPLEVLKSITAQKPEDAAVLLTAWLERERIDAEDGARGAA